MRKIAAHYVLPVSRPPVRNGILTLGDDGEVLNLSAPYGELQESEGVEFYSGALAPGFVNAHCHLELSHLRGVAPQRTGLAGFISCVAAHRDAFPGEQALRAASLADAQLHAGGTVAVGDVSNRGLTFEVKAHSPVFYHTFIERLGLRREDIEHGVRSALLLAEEAAKLGLSASLTPHAPYSTLPEMYAALAAQSGSWSVHNQESREENLLFEEGRGALRDLLTAIGLTPAPPTGKSSIYHTLQHAAGVQRLLLVHNTFTSPDDYDAAAACCKNISWVLCPSSNLYIEHALPPLQMLRAKGASIALGTDSLASNASLNLLDELKLLAERFPDIPLSETLRWATLGGAAALGLERTLGSLDKGKRPGVVLLSNLDLDKLKLTPETKSRLLTKKNAYICRGKEAI
ncbi:MAG: amidohydrolase family protein [Prevotellaceae bacterium]|jgi:cytosine/adenosine deaminase-related metal-dependent hydrolase|nr:amidohydrolase family protein [Prevotellaceae bacterium]